MVALPSNLMHAIWTWPMAAVDMQEVAPSYNVPIQSVRVITNRNVLNLPGDVAQQLF